MYCVFMSNLQEGVNDFNFAVAEYLLTFSPCNSCLDLVICKGVWAHAIVTSDVTT